MIAFDVLKNGRLLFRAGGFPEAILGANLMRASHVGDPPRWGAEIDVTAAGPGDSGWLEWTRQPVFPGDEVTFRLVEAEEGNPPSIRRSDKEFELVAEAKSLLIARTMYAGLKKRILELEEKWGDRL